MTTPEFPQQTQQPQQQPYQPITPGLPQQYQPQPPVAGAAKGLAIAALIVGIIGFMMGIVPVGGFIVGLVAVVLGSIALVKKQSKALALTGLILGAVGTICSIIVSIMILAALNQAASNIDALSKVTVDTSQGTNVEEKSDKASSSANTGTREKPVALGSTISAKEWDVVINSVTLNATESVLAANQFNKAPAEGTQYALVNMTASYKGDDSSYASMVLVSFVSASGKVSNTYDTMVVSPKPDLGSTELFTGGNATGNVAIQIPADADGVLKITPGIMAYDVFVALQ